MPYLTGQLADRSIISPQKVPHLIVSLQRFALQTSPRFCIEFLRGGREFMGTHRPATNLSHPPFDGLPKTFERDDALWSDNEYSDVVPAQDSTIRVSQGQSQRACMNKGETRP